MARFVAPLCTGFETPDDAYYVGLDMASALHPQNFALLWEMNGKPLPYNQERP